MVLKKAVLFIFFIAAGVFPGFSQTAISGKIINANKEEISGATVSITQINNSVILAYAISDASGEFEIDFDSEPSYLQIKVSHIGFKDYKEKFLNEDQAFSIQLEESTEELKEVFIESTIIDRSGDTISYNVSAFKGQKDRVIADVLAKMPGIEIKSSGAIYYQGKPIQKYYIEGLDLLEGRYSLANENLPAASVSKVQILENHQPIKMLDSLVFSERASLNIKLKNDVTITGSADLGTGLSPLLWDVNVTPMLFTKDNQAIFSFQSNNTGNEVSNVLSNFSVASFGRENNFNIAKQDWLSLRGGSTPSFSEERWLDNNVHLGAANYLIRLKKNFELKANISYVNDVQNRIGSTETTISTPTDTIAIFEGIENKLFFSSLQSQVTLERNTKENYLKNELKLNAFWNSARGIVDRTDGIIRQELENPYFAFSNNLKLLKPVGKQLITFKSNTGYTSTPQNLKVQPGQLEELLNDGDHYEELVQQVNLSNFFTDNSAGFTKGLGKFTLSPEIGFSIQDQVLESRIKLGNSENRTALGNNFQNNLHFLNSKIYAKTDINYKSGTWSLRLKLPLIYNSYKIEDEVLQRSQELDRFVFEPNFYVNKEITPFLKTSLSAGLNNSFGDIDRLYYGYILNNYRSIQRYDSPLAETFRQDYSWRFSYRNPLNSIFANASYSLGITNSNLLYSNMFNETGATIFEAVERENTSTSHFFNLGASKYFSKLNTTLSLGSTFSISDGEQLLNGEVIEVINRNLQFDFEVNTEITSWLSTEYNTEFSFFNTQLEDREFDKITTQQHFWDVTIYPADNQYFAISSELYTNSISGENSSNYFLNFIYQYTFSEKDLDLNIHWKNVLNTEEFVNVYNTDFSYVQSTYRLRPSQVLVGLIFSF